MHINPGLAHHLVAIGIAIGHYQQDRSCPYEACSALSARLPSASKLAVGSTKTPAVPRDRAISSVNFQKKTVKQFISNTIK